MRTGVHCTCTIASLHVLRSIECGVELGGKCTILYNCTVRPFAPTLVTTQITAFGLLVHKGQFLSRTT